jgi:fatty-acid desaturase
MQNIIELGQNRINWRDLVIITSFHLLLIPAVFMFSWQNLAAMLIGNWIVGSLGVGLGYHRLITHRSFKAPKWLEYTLTVFASMALQNEAYKWVATHRMHHQFCEKEGDPHSTRDGFLWSHIGWIFKGTAQDHDDATFKKYVPDLLKVFLCSDYCFSLYFIRNWRLVNGFLGRVCTRLFRLAYNLVCKFAVAHFRKSSIQNR